MAKDKKAKPTAPVLSHEEILERLDTVNSKIEKAYKETGAISDDLAFPEPVDRFYYVGAVYRLGECWRETNMHALAHGDDQQLCQCLEIGEVQCSLSLAYSMVARAKKNIFYTRERLSGKKDYPPDWEAVAGFYAAFQDQALQYVMLMDTARRAINLSLEHCSVQTTQQARAVKKQVTRMHKLARKAFAWSEAAYALARAILEEKTDKLTCSLDEKSW